jgi:predicted amidohydrolase
VSPAAPRQAAFIYHHTEEPDIMQDTTVTIASMRSVLIDPYQNLEGVKEACRVAHTSGARLLFLPELMLTGHGGHRRMVDNAEPVPGGPLCQAIRGLSMTSDLCVCVGIAELDRGVVYNSQIVYDRGQYMGLQRKINLSGDEYCYFGAGDSLTTFDIGEIRFGIVICYDNHFPELALLHSMSRVDLILAPHAARTGQWPKQLTPDFAVQTIQKQQHSWEKVHRARASDHNVYVLLNNAVGPSTEGLENVVANHAGTVMGIDPNGDVFLRSKVTGIEDEIVTVTLEADKIQRNHGPTRNRRPHTLLKLFERAVDRV